MEGNTFPYRHAHHCQTHWFVGWVDNLNALSSTEGLRARRRQYPILPFLAADHGCGMILFTFTELHHAAEQLSRRQQPIGWPINH